MSLSVPVLQHVVVGYRLAVPMVVAVVAAVSLAACNSKSNVTADSVLPATGSAPTGALDVGSRIQISPAPNPAFDLHAHDYTIDCTSSPTSEIAVVAPQTIGFTFLGTSGVPGVAQPYQGARFRQTFTLKPGQGFRFAIAWQGSYSIRCLPQDFPPLQIERNGTPQAQWYVFSPTLGEPTTYYTIITDSRGTPVWWINQPAIDAKVLGPIQIAWSPGDGTYVIRRFDGSLLNLLEGNLDFHDMQPTPSRTYLAFREVARVCPPDCADLSLWGGDAQATVTDTEIVELDQNSNVLWSWRTRDHIALSETGDSGWLPFVGGDIIHMNAIEPDGTDGLMFSARHLNAIYHITKRTGAVDWKIGGTPRPESLTVIGDLRPSAVGPSGKALSGQHDVRKWSDGTVSVHDNGSQIVRPPSIIRYRIDATNRTAEVVEEVHDERVSVSACCGSARRLPGGNWLVQWGGAPFLTELDPRGNPVLTIEYNSGNVFSYRAVPVLNRMVAAQTLRSAMDIMSRE
jgi:hypothetical protein